MKVHVADRTPLPQPLVDWLQSKNGQNAINACILKSQIALQKLQDARRIHPEHLHMPMTISVML